MAHSNRLSITEMPILGTITLLIGGVALFAASAPAVAADNLRTEHVIVTASDLSTVHGRNAVQQRVQRAAVRVCAVDDQRMTRGAAARRACVERAIAMSRLQMADILAARPMIAASHTSFQSPSATSPEEPSVL